MLKRLNVPEITGAAFVLLLGVAVIVLAREYPLGSLSRMGSGYFPIILGVLLILMGLVLVWEVMFAPPAEGEAFPFRPVIMVSLGIMTFAFLVERLGMVPAIGALVGLSGMAESPLRPLTLLVIALVMSLLGVLLFIRALGMPLSAFGG
ncbi:tripartite tricarboxylate transporter TctB family protein [Alcanivorax sp. JB21]|uniref:tripartite tricarboxylate transporter TctB family protein n=1 Tax=Alcanivorax limicola TaxID=2874102 RepID=UPI001CBD171E|nr:tripartite tricarboxylate transporter TctB family protein [Alcanivorax limicola]MBZ2187538.1 tripartite tricarboxylate transporter TctB family protein [Alcanivorax limicola]